MNKVRSKKAVSTRTCPYCKTVINAEASKCPNCCSSIKPEKIIPEQPSDLEQGLKKITKIAKKKVKKIAKITKR